jgi:hypothetical protein
MPKTQAHHDSKLDKLPADLDTIAGLVRDLATSGRPIAHSVAKLT